MLITVSMIIMFFVVLAPVMLIGVSIKANNVEKFSVDDVKVSEKQESFNLELKETIEVYNSNNKEIEEIPLEEYLYGVVASEMPASFEDEALRAQAVAARTYAVNKILNGRCSQGKGAHICDTTHCQVYKDKGDILNNWDKNSAKTYWEKIKKAVDDTKGEIITYDREIIKYPQFFAISWGKTENSVDVFSGNLPYLVSTESKGEEIAPKYTTDIKIELDEFINTINSNYQNLDMNKNNIQDLIKIKDKTEAGGIKTLSIGDEVVKGTDFRSLLKLSSTNFTFEVIDNSIVFHCKGYGHGVGMSQWGANVMGKEGHSYKEILQHYYNGVEINKISYK